MAQSNLSPSNPSPSDLPRQSNLFPPDIHFSSHQGGLICRDCEPAAVEKRRVDPSALALLQNQPVPPCAAAGAALIAFDVLDYHLTESIGRPLRLSQPLRDAMRHARVQ